MTSIVTVKKRAKFLVRHQKQMLFGLWLSEHIVSYCFTHPDIMNEVHEGTIFDKNVSVDNIFIYMVYLDKLKILSQVKCNFDFENYTKHQFKILLFHNEENTKKKIRLLFFTFL